MATTLLYWEDPVASGVIFASVLGNNKKHTQSYGSAFFYGGGGGGGMEKGF